MWEVVNSSWYQEAVSSGYGHPKRHFVISSADDLYEVLANSCSARPLTEEEIQIYDQSPDDEEQDG